MVLVTVLGVAIGIVGFLPLIVGLRLARKATATSNLGSAGALLLGVLVSFLLLAAALIACILVARDQVLPFTIAVVIALSITAIGYGIYTFVRK